MFKKCLIFCLFVSLHYCIDFEDNENFSACYFRDLFALHANVYASCCWMTSSLASMHGWLSPKDILNSLYADIYVNRYPQVTQWEKKHLTVYLHWVFLSGYIYLLCNRHWNQSKN